jgi:biotin transport system substrate-specific component
VPWFAEGSSGIHAPSFGYIVGFIVAAAVVGRIAESGATRSVSRTAGLMILGNVIIYAFGVVWLALAIDVPLTEAMSLGLVPFLLGDAVKIAAAAGLLPLAWKGLNKSGLVT